VPDDSDTRELPSSHFLVPVIGNLFPSLSEFVIPNDWSIIFVFLSLIVSLVFICLNASDILGGSLSSILFFIFVVVFGFMMCGYFIGRYIDYLFGFWSIKAFFEHFPVISFGSPSWLVENRGDTDSFFSLMPPED
jgi:membrane protein DedA with SNARE-associated domain